MSDMKKLLEAMDSMSKAEKKPTSPKFPGYWKGTDSAKQSRSKMVGDAQESVIKELAVTAKATSTQRKLAEEFASFKEQDMEETTNSPKFQSMIGKITSPTALNTREALAMIHELVYQGGASYEEALHQASVSYEIDPAELNALYKKREQGVAEGTDSIDTITMDVPLMIRLFEYAREDAQTDMDLHDVAERLIKLSQEGRTLTMHDYDTICPRPEQEVDEGWKDIVAGGALAAGMALGGGAHAADLSHYNTEYLQQVATGQHARPMVSADDAKAELQARAGGKQQATNTQVASNSGFSPEYLQQVINGTHPRPMVSVEKAQRLLQQMQQGVQEGHKDQEADYGPKYQAIAQRAGQAVKRIEKKLGPVDIQKLAAKLAAADKKLKQVKEVTQGPVTASGAPTTQASSEDEVADAATQKNLSKLKSINPQLNPQLAGQALKNIATNPQAPVAGAQMAQTKNLADLVGDALADPQKGSQVATMLQQVQQAQKNKKA